MTIERVRTFLSNERNGGRGQNAEALLRHLLSFNGECAYCGHPMEREGWDHIDHVDPVYNGGTGRIDNLLPCCVACNAEKGHFSADGWYHRLSTQRSNWPGALHPKAIEVRAAHGLDEDTFLALRATTIATHGEGREREDERRAREEAAQRAAEAEAQRERDLGAWRNANRNLIEAEAQRIAAALPPKVVEREVEKVVEVRRPRPWKRLAAVAGIATILVAITGYIVGYNVAPGPVAPEVVTRTVTKTVPMVKWKTRWKTRTVYKTAPSSVQGHYNSEPNADPERVRLCIEAVKAAVRENVRLDMTTEAEARFTIASATDQCELDPYNADPFLLAS